MREVARQLLETARTLVAKTTMGAWDGEEHFWPEPRGWEIVDWSAVDRFGSAGRVSYQNYDTGIIVDFDGKAHADTGGEHPGTYKVDAFGNSAFGKWKNEDEILKLLGWLDKWLKKGAAAWPKKLPKVSGWKISADDVDVTYYFERAKSGAESLLVNFTAEGSDSMPDVVFGDGTAEAEIVYDADYAPSGPTGSERETVRNIKGLRGIQDVLKRAERLYSKWHDKWY